MRNLLFILLFLSGATFADSVTLYIDYDGVWAPTIGTNNYRKQLCAVSTDNDNHNRQQVSDFCKLEFGANSGNFSFNRQENNHIYLYADKTSNKVIADLYPSGKDDCNYSVFLKNDGELYISKSSDLCKYEINAKVEKDHSFLKLSSSTYLISMN